MLLLNCLPSKTKTSPSEFNVSHKYKLYLQKCTRTHPLTCLPLFTDLIRCWIDPIWAALENCIHFCWHLFFSTSCIFFTLCLFSFVFLLPLTLDASERRFSDDGAADNRRCLGGHRTWWSFLNPEFSRIAEFNTVYSTDWAQTWSQLVLSHAFIESM